ncbi:MAG: aminotransferase class I/II-fold pyridoxal phosphate-dependent enzyme [Rhodospirillaceae bacterium]|nr:aminotransferase class I/II-fold pyridoxal phosphate-dependent enzyme [Rhodospirillaceae bacterium]
MVSDRLDALLTLHPFTRLNALLDGVAPGGPPLNMAVGEPQLPPPPLVRAEIDAQARDWSRYPLAQGTAAFRAAVRDWLNRRFALPPDLIDAERHVMPVAGTREALFHAALAAVGARWEALAARGLRPAVLVPDPVYHVYAGAAAVAGAEAVFMPATRETGFLPDPGALDPALLERTAIAYVCSPANPQGAVADLAYLRRWIALARRHGFVMAFDECYCEIHDGVPPPGALQAAALDGGGLDNLLVFHSLSKRSGAAGLRSGFIAGDARLVRRQAQLVNYGGVAVPYPILAASTALWRDEAHVEAVRAHYRANFDAAERILDGRFGFCRPQGGFFLWLEVGDGEAAARRLWAEAGLRVLPGGYMSRTDAAGRNAGAPYIRVALVHETAVVAAALDRLVAVLERNAPPPAAPRRSEAGARGAGPPA